MPAPYLGRALRGWTRRRVGYVVTSTINNGNKVERLVSVVFNANIQPTPEEEIKRLPQEYWSWKLWNVIIKDGNTVLATDDAFGIQGQRFRVKRVSDWRLSGFTKYTCIEDYDYDIAELTNTVTYNGEIVYYNGEVVTYA